MIRILGFLLGCALTASVFALLLRPTFVKDRGMPRPVLEARASAESDTLQGGEQYTGKTKLEMEPADTRISRRLLLDQPEEPTGDRVFPASDYPDDKRHRQLFWSPFRSRLAASGFASSLTNRSDVSVEVVKLSPAAFRVSFEYQDETERQAMIHRIESTTGLKLTEADMP